MKDNEAYGQNIAKIQHFFEYLKQGELELQALSIALGKSEESENIKYKISIYQEMIGEYHAIFQNILHV